MEKIMDEFFQKIGANTITGGILLILLRVMFYSVARKIFNRIAIIEDKQDAMVHGLKKSSALNGQFTQAYEDELERRFEERDRKGNGVNDFIK